MSSLIQVVIFSLLGGVLSLIGGLLILSRQSLTEKAVTFATPFAAGALLAAALLDLLPEAAEQGDIEVALQATLGGILLFFLLERFLRWFHHHHDHEGESKDAPDPKIPLIVAGDTLHNFIDGIAIAAGFLIDPTTGIIVTLAVAAHEIPQEIGDFGLLLQKGMEKRKVVMVNIISALATSVAAVVFFSLGQSVEVPLDLIIGLVAGFFMYIALSDIIPTIHGAEGKALAKLQSVVLIAGVVIVGSVNAYLHQYIDMGHDHAGESSHSHSDDKDEDSHNDEEGEDSHSGEDGDSHDDEDEDSHSDEDSR